MKRFFLTFFCIVAISAGVFYAVCAPHEQTAEAVDGVIDMRKADWSEVYALGGRWEFYWDRLYEPEDFTGGEKVFIETPMSWNGAGYPRTGHATYRLLLKLPEGADTALYVPEILAASAVWVNGQRVFSAGRLGSSAEDSVPYSKNEVLTLREHGGTAEIVVQVSNYHRMNGGIRHAFRVGSEHELIRWVFGRWLAISVVACAFFLVGFYHLALCLSQRETRGRAIYLAFAACCALAGLRFLIEQDSVAMYFSRSWLNIYLNPIYWALFTLHTGLIIMFMVMAFELKLTRATKILLALLLTAPLAMMPLPAPLNRFGMVFNIATHATILLSATRNLSKKRVWDRPYLGLLMAATLCYICWGPVANGPALAHFFAAPVFSNTLFMLSQFVMLSWDYAEARRKAEESAAKNNFYYRMSHALLTPLTKISTNVQIAKLKPEDADRLLAKSQAEIMKMAETINDALAEETGGGE
ncbi:hypothetical protein AGMMS50276_01080 [Synergistales bacterium]|nr:hypothetical protein AGMMS50276_01080 [Synergistales bacterium]